MSHQHARRIASQEFIHLAGLPTLLVLRLSVTEAWVLFCELLLALHTPETTGSVGDFTRELAHRLLHSIPRTSTLGAIVEATWRDECPGLCGQCGCTAGTSTKVDTPDPEQAYLEACRAVACMQPTRCDQGEACYACRSVRLARALLAGMDAWEHHDTPTDNPHSHRREPDLWHAWNNGYQRRRRAFLASMEEVDVWP